MKWKLSFPESPMLFYYWVKFIGLAPFTVKDQELRPPTLLHLLYPVFVAISYLLLVVLTCTNKLLALDTASYLEFRNFFNIIHHFTGFPGTFLTLMIFLFMHKRLVYSVNKLRAMSDELKLMGVLEDHKKRFKNILATIIASNIVLIAFRIPMTLMDQHLHIYTLIKDDVEIWFATNVILIFATLVHCIGQRFALVNEKLLDLFGPENHVGSSDDPQCVRKFEGLHLELCELLDSTIHLFGIPFLFIAFQFFIIQTLSCYWVVFFVRNASQFYTPGGVVPFFVDYIMGTVLEIVILSVALFAIVYVSVKTCQQGNDTKTVLSKVWNDRTPEELKEEFFIFSLQLKHKPVVVSIFGFFNLDYSYLGTIFSAMVAYAISLIQFKSEM